MDDVDVHLCRESETCLDEEIVEEEQRCIEIGNQSEAEDDYVDTLLAKETSFGFRKEKSLVFGNWDRCARLEAIAWILKVSSFFFLLLFLGLIHLGFGSIVLILQTREVFGFGFQTAYLSMIYFDRFLSRRAIIVRLQFPFPLAMAS